ncbi:MAG TPA: FAD-dependent oxidoreductase, partial [Luteolibacter sp.]|nr:FAD-dependent oxidoreductase [Luteolibacter sp.]
MPSSSPSAAASILLSLSLLVLSHAAPSAEAVKALRYHQPPATIADRSATCDVAVYGGTPGGVAAAIQAARAGKSAILLSFDNHVGGLTSGGLTATDLGHKESIGGISREFYDRIGRMTDFSPSLAETTFRKMLEEAGVQVIGNQHLMGVEMKDGRISHLHMDDGRLVRAQMFIDATYEGDLLAAAKVSYRVGREPRAAFNESLAGQWQQESWKGVYQFCDLPIDPYRVPGDPNSGLLPEIASAPAGKPGQGDSRVQAYNFRMFLSQREDRIPFPKPADYRRERFALLERFLHADPRIRWTLNYTTKPMTDGPVQMRTGDSNNAGSFSSDLVDGSHRWPDGTFTPDSFDELPPPRRGLPMPFAELYKIREAIFQDHVNYQQGLMHFLANDPAVPAELRERVNKFGLDPAEFQRTGYWPHALYVREGRRMVSDYIMTQDHCESKRVATDSIGLASYAMDSHFCQRVVVSIDGKATVRNEGAMGKACPKPYPVSYRSIVPRAEECTNLLVPVCLSSTHIAYG